MKFRRLLLLFACALLAAPASQAGTINLAGEWQVRLGENYAAAAPAGAASLPGTLDDAGIGTPPALAPELTPAVLAHLHRKHAYIGVAWWTREIEIPQEWAGKKILLELERVLWQSQVFIDGKPFTTRDSLSVPHIHDLGGALKPGKHKLALRIDNNEIYKSISHHMPKYVVPASFPCGHAYTNHTQIMWNGVLGRINLRAVEPFHIKNVSVFPTAGTGAGAAIKLNINYSNTDATGSSGTIKCVLRRDGEDKILAETTRPAKIAAGADAGNLSIEWELPQNLKIETWDEFSPALYKIEISLAGAGADEPPVPVVFGFRDFAARDADFILNGKRIFLRGNLECIVFPLTGCPPTGITAWRKMFSDYKKWGLNHIRFHSWCPPEAAFAAADEAGVYLQVELPHWFHGDHDAQSLGFLDAEAARILETYGNHPSFLLLTLGNELSGSSDWMDALTEKLRVADPRHLYAASTYSHQKNLGRVPAQADEILITQRTDRGWIRGQGFFNDFAPSFDKNYSATAAHVRVPLVSHEIGQYAVSPDMREIDSYTGNLVPLNFIAIRDDLQKKGLLPLAGDFTRATAKFAALLYKEEIERALRTPEFDGFQLLSLQDFPGQGTALVGLVNAFWEPKGDIKPEEFRQACAPLVPLALFPKAVYERGEIFHADIKVANFLKPLPQMRVEWRIAGAGGETLARGATPARDLPIGNRLSPGAIGFAIPPGAGAEKMQLELRVAVADDVYINRWNFWVYPPAPADDKNETRHENVLVTGNISEALRALGAGGRVLLAPKTNNIKGIEGCFVPVFWSPVHFPKQPGTMGILCDPAHPALRDFPTDFHSDWQWWELATRSKAVEIAGLPVTPLVRVIDNFAKNRALANVFEARVGTGSLLFCSIDITGDLAARPAARQLRRSLLRYTASPGFRPAPELAPAQLAALASE
ncbi:hypothetical protein OH491_10025 [Termitidicoccus mucosus]|uniref:Glycoside hydrolase family 2 n=1 Tax=Termitidicoccus mucosus TaxID=1184151 RepID=A0A178IHW7_9BACT|nr:hypothetical protein AW736_17320 [Opitutaceae bacterium TSB47]